MKVIWSSRSCPLSGLSRLSEGTARRYGLYPRKGSLLEGGDADLTIVDPNRPWTIRNDELHSKNPLSPWAGRSGEGAPVATVLRGNVVMRDGELTGGRVGKFIPQGRLPNSAHR